VEHLKAAVAAAFIFTVYSNMPPKRPPKQSAAAAALPKRRRRNVSPAASESQSESSSDGSDPDDDVLEGDLFMPDGQHVLDFECVRDASRDRVAVRTRTQYDQFIGMMVVFALSREEFKHLVVVRQHLSTFKPPLPIQFVSEYLAHVERKRVPWPGKAQKLKPVCPNYYKAVVLSLKDLYVCEQTIMADDMLLLLDSKRKKFIREIQEMRAVGTYPSASQRYITSDGYRELAANVAKANPRDYGGWAVQAFSALWGYVVLLWCLMARCDRVARLRWADLGWYKDAMTAYICKSKCDQAGVNAFDKKLYFNDACAEVCPVTALSIVFFSREDESIRSDFVFPRSDTRRAGARYLRKIIESHYTPSQFSLFGCNPLDISWHYFKRGAFTFLAGLTDACSFVATKMRADQKVADVSRVYSFFGQGQDGVVGRLLSMLPYGEQEFVGCAPMLSPVHAPDSWIEFVPDWESLDERFKNVVVPRFFAVLVYRLDWLKQHLPSNHPLWHSKAATSGKLLQYIPHVQLESRPLAGLTGVSLEMKNALRLASLAQGTTLPIVAEGVCSVTSRVSTSERLAPSERDDLGLRLLTPLPGNERVVPHLTCHQAWRAWFLTTDSLPYPLRYAEGKLGLGSDITALSRMKTVMNVLSQGIHGRDILQHTEATFQCAFAHLQTQLFDVDANLRIYSYNTCGTIEKKLRNAKASGWHPTNATFNVGVIPKRPDIYDAAEVQEQQLTRRENAVRATNAFQCERCASLCMHCMHCDTCVVRLDAAVSRYNEVAQAPALGEGDASVAVEFLPPRKEGVRCLRCMRAFYDKSGFNRHVRTTPECTPSSFEFVLRKDNGVRKVAPPPPHPDATGQAVSMYVRTNTSNIYE
jgi:ferredoxin